MSKDVLVGVGYRPRFSEAFSGGPRPRVDYLEAITENFLPERGRATAATQTLQRLRRDFPLALHGVSLSIGSADPLHEPYLAQLEWLCREMDPFLVTDHLCWTSVAGDNLFDLLPIPYTAESLAHVAEKVERVQERLRRPIALENITYYLEPVPGEMPEEEFLNALADRTGCGFLLDVNNLYVNAVNLGLDPARYLARLKLRHVVEIHLAGHSAGSSGLLIDTHAAPVPEPVWHLLEGVLRRTGIIPTMIERDENIPAWEEMEAELARVYAVQDRVREGRHGASRLAGTLSR